MKSVSNRGDKAYRWCMRQWYHDMKAPEIYHASFEAYVAGYARALADVKAGTTDQRRKRK